MQEMLECAARSSSSRSSDIIGLVAVSTAAQEEEEQEVLGACTGQIEESNQGEGELVLLTLVVGEGARRRGLGASLAKALIQEGSKRAAAGGFDSLVRVVTDVSSLNRPAITFLAGEGFVVMAAPAATSSDGAVNKKGGFGGVMMRDKKGAKKTKQRRKERASRSKVPAAPASVEMILDLVSPKLTAMPADEGGAQRLEAKRTITAAAAGTRHCQQPPSCSAIRRPTTTAVTSSPLPSRPLFSPSLRSVSQLRSSAAVGCRPRI